MRRRVFILLTCMAAAIGCVTRPPPLFQFPNGTRVGILNQLESYITHQNYQPIRVGNFTKTYDVDWKIPAYVNDQLMNALKNDPRYTIKSLNAPKAWSDPSSRGGPIANMDQINPEATKHLEALADANDLDVIIWIKSFRGPSPFEIAKHPIELQGYGMFTRELLLSKKAYAYANTEVVVFKVRPLTLIGSGRPKINDSPLKDIYLPEDLNIIPSSELIKLRPIIQTYADQAIKDALHNANLVAR